MTVKNIADSVTCHVIDGLESESKASDLQGIVFLAARVYGPNANPVLLTEHSVIVERTELDPKQQKDSNHLNSMNLLTLNIT